jgi:hypothetical protein
LCRHLLFAGPAHRLRLIRPQTGQSNHDADLQERTHDHVQQQIVYWRHHDFFRCFAELQAAAAACEAMKQTSKLVRFAVLALSLTLLTVYVVYSQSRGRMATPKTEEEFVPPSSKALTHPVFSTSKLESKSTDKGAEAIAVPPPKP